MRLEPLDFAHCAEEVAIGVPGADASFDVSNSTQLQRLSEAQLAILDVRHNLSCTSPVGFCRSYQKIAQLA